MCVEFVNDFVRKCLCLCTITRQRLFDATVASSVSHNLAETVLDLCNSYVLIDAEHVEIYIHAYIHTHTYTYIYIYIYIVKAVQLKSCTPHTITRVIAQKYSFPHFRLAALSFPKENFGAPSKILLFNP